MSNLFLIMDALIEVGKSAEGFCANSADIWQVVGIVLLVFKIVIPILLIVFGIMDLGKAVVGSKDDEVKKSIRSLAMRAIAAVVIFFIPTLVTIILGLISGFGDLNEDFEVCKACITRPNGDECSRYLSNESLED